MATQNTSRKASPAQVKYLHGLYRAVGWDKEYKYILKNDFGVNSTKDLTLTQAHELIGLLKILVQGEQEQKATYKQITYIRSQWLPIDFSKGEQGDCHLNAFILKRFKKEKVDFLTKQEAIKLINMIKIMTKQATERKGKTTVMKRRTRCVNCGSWIMWVELKNGRREAFDCDEDRKPTNFHNCK